MASSFVKLIAWQKSIDFAGQVYKISSLFPKEEKYGLIDQIRRAAVSISSNIAEGSSRGSNAEYARFLLIARGSCAEVESQLFLAETFDYISVEQRDKLIEEADEIMRILTTLIQKYKS